MKVRVVIPKRTKSEINVRDGAQCQECHRAVAPNAISCPHCRAPIVRKYCPGCSRLIAETTSVCPLCGVSAKARPKTANWSLVTNVLVIGGLTLLALVLLRSGQKDSPSSITSERSVKAQPDVAPLYRSDPHQRIFPDLKTPEGEPAVRSDEEGARLNALGHSLIQQGKYEEAIQVLKLAVQTFPKGTTAISYKFSLYNLGHSLRRVGRPEEALPLLQQCFRIDNQWQKLVQELNLAQQAVERKKVYVTSRADLSSVESPVSYEDTAVQKSELVGGNRCESIPVTMLA